MSMGRSSITGWDLPGKEICDTSFLSMSKTRPPKHGIWSSYTSVSYEGNLPQDNIDLKEELHLIREDWLSQFTLQISQSPEKGYRYWRWIDESDRIRWWERRSWDDLEPKIIGFWPS